LQLSPLDIDGLKDEIKSDVIIQRPDDMDTACSLAMLQEDVLLHMGIVKCEELISTTLIVLQPSQRQCPYHCHLLQITELLVILESVEAVCRTPVKGMMAS
jgi:hypothetical protein